MKFAAVSLLAVVVSLTAVQAGSFGGPRPFTNGSPLVSGVDGSYQANARGTNTTGVIRFAYSGGNQTSSQVANSYVIFSEGIVFSGQVAANITESTITGVLESGLNFFDVTSTGYFNAKINPKSPVYSFKGSGFIQAFIEDAGLYYNFFGRTLSISGIRNSQNTGS